ncbi:serine/threonine protein kinase [Acaryochloris marina]|uniref:non-specific serine/threonine protein kinase n=1 Tax=Acaryochloris marina (strain MBIC 11017) TaxID=329726 RepID=A8ZQK5_ACAM1|nr:serine/threonine-protein kinase [Acaryochloris marina]ABW33291.1 serine/threonine protein kinase [Acaryochloris marina MBIC11017]
MLIQNQYRIIKQLGEQNGGITYLAEDLHHPSKQLCVVKQTKPFVLNPTVNQRTPKQIKLVQERLNQEAVSLVEVSSENDQISKLYTCFEKEGQFYWVREWIEGQSLAKWEYPVEPGIIIEILCQTLLALDSLHSQRILHLNLKPSNIIWRKGDSKVVLTDFGVFKEITSLLNLHDEPGPRIVPFSYRSPEQSKGSRTGPFSDYYSLGLTMIILMIGNSFNQFEQEFHFYGEVSWRQYVPEINPVLADILERAIHYDPGQRFVTAREMLVALQEVPVEPSTM